MTKLDKFRLNEKIKARDRADWTCEICGQPAQNGERCHILKDNDSNNEFLSPWLIDCHINFLWGHSHCNSKADMGNRLDGRVEHIKSCVEYLDKHPDIPPLQIYDTVSKQIFYTKKYKIIMDIIK